MNLSYIRVSANDEYAPELMRSFLIGLSLSFHWYLHHQWFWDLPELLQTCFSLSFALFRMRSLHKTSLPLEHNPREDLSNSSEMHGASVAYQQIPAKFTNQQKSSVSSISIVPWAAAELYSTASGASSFSSFIYLILSSIM